MNNELKVIMAKAFLYSDEDSKKVFARAFLYAMDN